MAGRSYSSGDPGAAVPDMEFRRSDGAWYSVRALLQGDRLTLKFPGNPTLADACFLAGHFKRADDVQFFRQRFRLASVQLQDHQCSRVLPGTIVCAALSSEGDPDEVHFYDALVDSVESKEHILTSRGRECICIFKLTWLQGPKFGSSATAKIEDICIIQLNPHIDPTVVSFLDKVMEKFQMASLNSGPTLLGTVSKSKGGSCDERPSLLQVNKKSCFQDGETVLSEQLDNAAKRTGDTIIDCDMRIKQNVDLGRGTIYNQHFILLTNLEKDLSSRTVVEFIHSQISLTTEVCLFPSLPSELYTRGIVLFNCKEDLEKLYNFFDNPNHIIISLTGRPLVIAEKISEDGLLMSIVNLRHDFQDRVQGVNDGNGKALKVACVGTEEFNRAKDLRKLFKEFSDHQERLHKSLAHEESRILMQYSCHGAPTDPLPSSLLAMASLSCTEAPP